MNGGGFCYSAAVGEWEPTRSSLPHGSQQLRCLTWNVWSGDYGFEERCERLLRDLRQSSADIIALQEVTPALLNRLLSCAWVRRDYILSEVTPPGATAFDQLTLFRRPPRAVRRIPLPSKMRRTALLAEVDTPDGVLAVVNVHLESMQFLEAVRAEQLAVLFQELEPYDQALILGDFNFCSSWPQENGRLDSRYSDLWAVLHPELPGYTEDTTLNSMRLAQTKKTKHVRFDRILLRDDRGKWSPRAIDLLGRQPIGPELLVSDHFGLLAELAASPQDAPTLLMLGRDHKEYGSISRGELGAVTTFMSVGGDRVSPSMAFKADKAQPNEDVLLVKRRDHLYLLAVADSHYGIEASHVLLERLAARDLPETRLDLLKLCLEIQKPHEDASSGTTLVVALYDAISGHLLALSTGDSTLATLDDAGWLVRNAHDSNYLRLDGLNYPDNWCEMELFLQPNTVLALHTDGIDECHYRKPETSLTPARIEAIWRATEAPSLDVRVPLFGGALVQAALDGVGEHPGGQDNIALILVAHLPPAP